MSSATFGASRRYARSSRLFRLALLCSLLFCIFVFWFSSLTSYDSISPQPNWDRPRNAAEMTNTHIQKSPGDVSEQSTLKVGVSSQRDVVPLRLVSYNIRYATTDTVKGEEPWRVRSPKLFTQLNFIAASHENVFFCLQEALYPQVNDIQEHLGNDWSHVGRGRDEDPRGGEFSPIFYRSDIWKRVRSDVRWLSPTPEKPSKGWDAVLNRIVTMAEFSHRINGTRVIVMSTHFDHIGPKARLNSAKLLIKFAAEWSQEGEEEPAVVLIGGDFNSAPDDGAYKAMTAEGSGMSDVFDLIPEEEQYGNYLTYTGFQEADAEPKRIDFVFIQEPRKAKIKTFGVLSNLFDDKLQISDHRPVVTDMDIPV